MTGLLVISQVGMPLVMVRAADPVPTLKTEIDRLNGAVKEKRDREKELDGLIDKYRQRIKDQETQQATLQNQVILLENRIQEKDLAVQRTQAERDALTLEISLLENQLLDQQAHIQKQRDLLGEVIRHIRQADEVSDMDVLLTSPNLSTFFDHIEQLKRLERQMGSSVQTLKEARRQLEITKKQRDDRRDDLALQEKRLKQDQLALESEQGFKTSLVSETQNKQEEFERIVYELRQQQETTSNDIAVLENRLKDRLNIMDRSLARGDVLLNWPVPPRRGISAHFHDPTYPFRNLFEHPGTDIPTPVGTQIHAAAGGYVAWTKTGKAYGNYMMIVHPGNIATVYAHLSKFIAKPDTYVSRGDVVALSGGRPGDAGAGLSTGPHLHFEVRQNGIPVNAENFLPDIGD